MFSHPAILERLIAPAEGHFSPDLAKHVLAMDFPPADRVRYTELATRARAAPLSADDRCELDEYLLPDMFLSLLHSKAKASVRAHSPDA
jgi:hypothetical protein